jgi:molecular chaperone GrpE
MEQRDNSGFDPAGSADDFSADGDEGTEEDVAPGAPASAVTDLERRLREQQEKYLRMAAEYENYRKRTTKERTEAFGRAQADLVKQLLDPLDDLARFAHVDPTTVDANTVVQGAEMVEKKLVKTLTSAGMELVDPVNQTFDPKVHEAVATEPALSPEDDHVVARVYQVGYLFNGQLLRPARVVVKQWNG